MQVLSKFYFRDTPEQDQRAFENNRVWVAQLAL